MKTLKYIYIAVVAAGAAMILAAMIIDTSNIDLSENLLKFGIGALIAGIVLYIPLFIKDKFKK